VQADWQVLPQLSSVLRMSSGTTGPTSRISTSRSKSSAAMVDAELFIVPSKGVVVVLTADRR